MGEGRRQPTPNPSGGGEDNPPAGYSQEGETGGNPPQTPPRRGEMGMIEEVGVTIVNLGFFCPTMSLKY
ncbi:hypothetical protein [Okeania sp. SIO1I7]|uniref:hypothetical protein n=1 Tax=Okeania sp. SIO1I7 TaxID=2607772 RepID=UPI0013F8DBFD|nr:hypothetical protein [Okeania sp. SIO1I7]NET29415.1 hypothetical protein [Okeania sp. SIO1I7]